MRGSQSDAKERPVPTESVRSPTAWRSFESIAPPIACKVLLVCESTLVRHVFNRILAGDDRIAAVGVARSVDDALFQMEQTRPQAVLFDGELPAADIQRALGRLRDRYNDVGAVVCQPLQERCSVLLPGLALTTGGTQGLGRGERDSRKNDSDFAVEVRRKLLEISGCSAGGSTCASLPPNRPAAMARSTVSPAGEGRAAELPSLPRTTPEVLAIGCSTGGPAALTQLLPMLPRDFPLPVLIVQHMPAHFTKLLAERLARVSQIPVIEAEQGIEVLPGVALVAPGDFHLRLVRKVHRVMVQLTQDPLENSCRPAVDVLFRSVAEIYGARAIATVLTGMGQDGLKGARVLKERAAPVFVQDKETSVVWGMPGAIAGAGLADSILPLEQITPAILRLL